MIVYGDPQFDTTIAGLFQRLRECIVSIGDEEVDGLRTLLIQTGQFEQAIADLPLNRASAVAQKMTELAATAFYAAYALGEPELPPPSTTSNAALNQLRRMLGDASSFS